MASCYERDHKSWGDSAYEKGGDARRLALGCKFSDFGHLGCSGQNTIIFSREGLVYGCKQKNIKIYIICLCFNMVSFGGQKELGPRPDQSPLGV